jgi:ferric-dicitrate binding protein FerR (iron transport regulator)
VLKGSSFSKCRAGGKQASAALTRRQIRRLRANANGNFRTNGRNSSATVRGTIWDVTDRCDGTLTKVRRGRVVVRDFRRKRNIILTKGKSYLARAPG